MARNKRLIGQLTVARIVTNRNRPIPVHLDAAKAARQPRSGPRLNYGYSRESHASDCAFNALHAYDKEDTR